MAKSKERIALEASVKLGLMDHEILFREGARTLVEEMGLDARDIPFYPIEHRPDLFKGATLDGCTKIGEKRMAIGAHELAKWCCDELNLEYRFKFNVGSALRECCGKLVAHFTSKCDPTELPQ